MEDEGTPECCCDLSLSTFLPLSTVHESGSGEAIPFSASIPPAPPRLRWPLRRWRWRGAAGSIADVGLGSVRKVEAAPSLRNKIRRSFLYLIGLRSGSNDGLGGCFLVGASDLGGLGLPVTANRHGIFFRGGVSGGRRRGRAEVSFGIYDGFPDFAGGVGFGKM